MSVIIVAFCFQNEALRTCCFDVFDPFNALAFLVYFEMMNENTNRMSGICKMPFVPPRSVCQRLAKFHAIQYSVCLCRCAEFGLVMIFGCA